MKFKFKDTAALATHLEDCAINARKKSASPIITKRQKESLIGQAFGYEQSAMLVKNAEFTG